MLDRRDVTAGPSGNDKRVDLDSDPVGPVIHESIKLQQHFHSPI
jgi:hypothetical protein